MKLFKSHTVRVIGHCAGPVGEDAQYAHGAREHIEDFHIVTGFVDDGRDRLEVESAAVGQCS